MPCDIALHRVNHFTYYCGCGVKWFTLRTVDLSALEALRDRRRRHKLADNALREELHTLIRQLPADSDKRAIERASGISRTTVYKLLAEGNHRQT